MTTDFEVRLLLHLTDIFQEGNKLTTEQRKTVHSLREQIDDLNKKISAEKCQDLKDVHQQLLNKLQSKLDDLTGLRNESDFLRKVGELDTKLNEFSDLLKKDTQEVHKAQSKLNEAILAKEVTIQKEVLNNLFKPVDGEVALKTHQEAHKELLTQLDEAVTAARTVYDMAVQQQNKTKQGYDKSLEFATKVIQLKL